MAKPFSLQSKVFEWLSTSSISNDVLFFSYLFFSFFILESIEEILRDSREAFSREEEERRQEVILKGRKERGKKK